MCRLVWIAQAGAERRTGAERVLDNGLWSTADCGCCGGYVTHLYTHSQSVTTHGVVCALKDESFRTALPFMRSDDRSMETPIPYTPCFYCVLKHRSGRIVDRTWSETGANSETVRAMVQAKSVPVRQESSRYATANGSPRPPAPGQAGRGKRDSTQGIESASLQRDFHSQCRLAAAMELVRTR